jgi:hypothetical protein
LLVSCRYGVSLAQQRLQTPPGARVHAVPAGAKDWIRAAEEELARLEGAPARPIADVERLIPRLAEEIRSGVEALPKTLAAGNVDLARQELKGYLGSIRVGPSPRKCCSTASATWPRPSSHASPAETWQVLMVAGGRSGRLLARGP